MSKSTAPQAAPKPNAHAARANSGPAPVQSAAASGQHGPATSRPTPVESHSKRERVVGPYREIFTLPGAAKFSFAGLLARFPIAVLSLGIVLFIQGATGSYALAGSVSAVFMIAQAIANPFIAKQIDRHGQARVMVPVVAVNILANIALMLVVYLDLWMGLIYICAAVGGATMGSIGALVRARWVVVAKTPKQLSTAFSWEAVADEMLFVTGPAIVTAIATTLFPPAGLLMAIITVGIGSALFYSQKATEPAPAPKATKATRGKVMSNSGILVVVIIELLLGVNFGAIDVSTVGFADEQGVKGTAGIALGIYAAGSMLAGAVAGTLTFRSQARFRYAPLLVAIGGFAWLLQLAHSMVGLCIIVFIMGLTIAPTLILGSQIVQELAPPKRLTEALAWASTAMSFGVAIGTSLCGVVVDNAGALAAFLVPAAASSIAAVLAVVFNRRFDPTVRSHSAREAARTNLPTSRTRVL